MTIKPSDPVAPDRPGSEDRYVVDLDLGARTVLEPRYTPIDKRSDRLQQLAESVGQPCPQLVGDEREQLFDELGHRLGIRFLLRCTRDLPAARRYALLLITHHE